MKRLLRNTGLLCLSCIFFFLLRFKGLEGHSKINDYLPPHEISLLLKAKTGRSFEFRFKQKEGKVIAIAAPEFYFLREFTGGNSTIGLTELGYYDEIPERLIKGKCQFTRGDSYCLLKVHFSTEEITTLFIHFAMAFKRGNNWIYHGAFSEIHQDQGMILFKEIYEF